MDLETLIFQNNEFEIQLLKSIARHSCLVAFPNPQLVSAAISTLKQQTHESEDMQCGQLELVKELWKLLY